MILNLALIALLSLSLLVVVRFISTFSKSNDISNGAALGARSDVNIANIRTTMSFERIFARPAVLTFSLAFVILGSIFLYTKLGYQQDVEFMSALKSGRLDAQQSTDYLIYRTERYNHYSDWYYLAEHYETIGKASLAASVYKTALHKFPEDGSLDDKVRILNSYAQSLFISSDKQVTEPLKEVVQHALNLAPQDSSALGFSGVIAFDAEDFSTAFSYWKDAFRFSLSAQERVTLLKTMIQAQNWIGRGVNRIKLPVSHMIYLNLVTSSTLGLAPDTQFLVYAKVADLPYPISVQKVSLNDWSSPILLTNLDYMLEGKTLADYQEVDIFVRVVDEKAKSAVSGRIVGELLNVPTQTQKIFDVNVVL